MKLFIISILAICITACGKTTKTTNSQQYDTLYKALYAKRFQILENQDSVILRVYNPWQGAENITYDYSFAKQRATPPRVICMSSSHVAYLNELGLFESIVGVSGANFITNPKVKENNIPEVGYDNSLNYEVIVALKPDYVFVYEVAGGNNATIKKLQQLGVNVIYVADYLENSPLGRAEWLVAFGTIFGQTNQATNRIQEIITAYNKVKDSVATIKDDKPKIMLNSPYKDAWYLPSDQSYMVQLINDAGGDYLGKGTDSDTSRPVSVETAYDLLSKADLWLNPSLGLNTMAQIREQQHRFANLPVVKLGNVYNNDVRNTPQGGSDFWESGSVNADVVLRDLAKIFHPNYFKNVEFYYYRKIK